MHMPYPMVGIIMLIHTSLETFGHLTPGLFYTFIARQHALAYRARYCYTISVCLSVRHVVVLYLYECIYRRHF